MNSPTILKNVLCIALQTFLYFEAFESEMNSDLLYYMVKQSEVVSISISQALGEKDNESS